MPRSSLLRASTLFSVLIACACSGGEPGKGPQLQQPAGALGQPCAEGGGCNAGLLCSSTNYCQPAISELPAAIKQAVPPPDSFDVPTTSPILLFTTGQFSSVSFVVENHTTEGVDDVTGQTTVTTLKSSTDKDVFVITPKQAFSPASAVVVRLSGDITGTLSFNVGEQVAGDVSQSLGFEPAEQDPSCSYGRLPPGWVGFGDTAAIGATGSMVPSSGERQLALSTGTVLCGQAIAGTSSLVVSGPIDTGGSSSLSFDYEFQSSEFDDFCNSEFDDTFLAVLSGPKGAIAEVVNTVNLVCADGSQADAEFPTQPDGGDGVYRSTGPLSHSLVGDVGSPVTLSFVLTDVGDEILSTVVGVDAVRLAAQ